VPVQAQGISTSGSSGPTAADIAASVRLELQADFAKLDKIARLHGVGASLVVSPNQRTAGALVQSITSSGDTVTVSEV